MIKYSLLPIILFITFLSCSDKNMNKSQNQWDKIAMKMDLQLIEIFNETDTIISTTWKLKDSVVAIGEVWHLRTDIKKEKIYVEKTKRDSIHDIVMNMITNPVFTDIFASCYVGNIIISVKSNNTELNCRYSSVGDWTNISEDTKELYRILQKKIKVSTQ
jgi:hypothetical protein